jgi:hypothetical protein
MLMRLGVSEIDEDTVAHVLRHRENALSPVRMDCDLVTTVASSIIRDDVAGLHPRQRAPTRAGCAGLDRQLAESQRLAHWRAVWGRHAKL